MENDLKIKGELSCQYCAQLTDLLSEKKILKSQLQSQLMEFLNNLSKLKDLVWDLKSENLSSETCLKQQAKIWRPPLYCPTSFEDTCFVFPRCLSINSRPPMVRPRKLKKEQTIGEPNVDPGEEVLMNYSFAAYEDESEIFQIQPGCEGCKRLQEIIKQAVADINMLNDKLKEKENEKSSYQKEVAGLEVKKRESQILVESKLRRDLLVGYTFDSSSSTNDSNSNSSSTELTFTQTNQEENTLQRTFLTIFEEYKSNKASMKVLQARQDSIVEQLISIVEQSNLSEQFS